MESCVCCVTSDETQSPRPVSPVPVELLVLVLVLDVVPLGPVAFQGCWRGTSKSRSIIAVVLSNLIW